jgi:hypothetical protein
MLVSNPNDEQVTPQQLQLRIKLNQEYQSEIALIEQKAQFYLKNQEEISVHPNSVEIIGATRENKQKLLNEISRVSESAPVKSSTYVVVSPALYRPPMLAAFDYQQKDFQQKTDVLFIDDLRELHASLLILAKKRFVFHQFLFSLTPLLFTTDHHVLHILEELAEKSIPVFNTTLYDGLRYLKDERFYLSTQELSQLRTAVEAIIWNEVEFYVSLLRNSIETMVESIQYPQAITESFTQKILSALHSSTNVQEFFIKIFPYIQKEMETSYISALETTNQMIRLRSYFESILSRITGIQPVAVADELSHAMEYFQQYYTDLSQYTNRTVRLLPYVNGTYTPIEEARPHIPDILSIHGFFDIMIAFAANYAYQKNRHHSVIEIIFQTDMVMIDNTQRFRITIDSRCHL